MPDDQPLPRDAQGYVDLDALEAAGDEPIELAVALLRQAPIAEPSDDEWTRVLDQATDPASAFSTDFVHELPDEEPARHEPFEVGADEVDGTEGAPVAAPLADQSVEVEPGGSETNVIDDVPWSGDDVRVGDTDSSLLDLPEVEISEDDSGADVESFDDPDID